MKRVIVTFVCAALAASLLSVAGCNKKVTKVEPAPQPQPVDTVTAPAPVERESFDTVDPDAAAKEALQTVYFDYDKTDLRPATVEQLQAIGRFLDANKTVSVLCEGHADERGSNEYNMGLGERRSRAVKDWLVNYGTTDRRLEITSFGRERPAFPSCGEDEPCHAKNRRVEFKVLAK